MMKEPLCSYVGTYLFLGIYVTSSNKHANPRYHGLGMRIEDDVLVTESDVEVLTASCPKNPDELQQIVGSSSAQHCT